MAAPAAAADDSQCPRLAKPRVGLLQPEGLHPARLFHATVVKRRLAGKQAGAFFDEGCHAGPQPFTQRQPRLARRRIFAFQRVERIPFRLEGRWVSRRRASSSRDFSSRSILSGSSSSSVVLSASSNRSCSPNQRWRSLATAIRRPRASRARCRP